MTPELVTKTGKDFYEVASLLQKSLRRGDVVMAARAVNELIPRYANYCWNRLMTVSAEDCAEMVTTEVVSLFDAWQQVNKGRRVKDRGRVFFAKAIIVLARCRHSRDADELNLLIVDRLPDPEWIRALSEVEHTFRVDDGDFEIPAYVYDVHTRRGRRMGKTHRDFLRDEHDALVNPQTIFRNANEMIDSPTYVQPELDL